MLAITKEYIKLSIQIEKRKINIYNWPTFLILLNLSSPKYNSQLENIVWNYKSIIQIIIKKNIGEN